MKVAVRYYTRTGNTKRLAEAVAKAVGAEALPISVPVGDPVDVLFLGNSYYAFSIDPQVRDFVSSLDKNKVGRIVNFGSAAMLNSTWKKVKAEADKAGIPMDEREFHCKGEFKGVHKGKPDAQDLAAAADFAKGIIKVSSGGKTMKALVTYFSASGVTAKVAKRLADAIGSPVYEIRPEVPYTSADLDWRDKQSRSTLEMSDKNCRPALADKDAPVADADVIFVGYPVWWYREPSIVDSFLAAYDFSGKKVVPFATSGSSGIGEEAPARMHEITGAEVDAGKRFAANASADELKAWAEQFLK